jgi:threonylcarbamoyladenosine tRNA methylthiotransferase MtaB
VSRRFSVATLGCKVNQIDSAVIGNRLEQAGYQRVSFKDLADVVLINTCAVTAKADRDGRRLAAKARAKSPEAIVIITGCSPTTTEAPDSYPEADLICGNSEKDQILDLIDRVIQSRRPQVLVDPVAQMRSVSTADPALLPGRTRAYLKIQDGCSNSCTYCIVPAARGKSRSVPQDLVLERYQKLVAQSAKEIVLTGIHLGAWGGDLPDPPTFSALVDRLTADCKNVRLRLSSIEPLEIDSALLEIMAARDNFCPHLHIPLQSGSDRILGAMNRNYDAGTFVSLCDRIDRAVPGVTIGTDIIVGFPGETDADFLQTMELVEKTALAHLHVFAYSKRPGTPAADFPDPIPDAIVKHRSEVLRDLGEQKRRAHYERFVGRRLFVLSEGRKENGLYGGMSENYIPIRFNEPIKSGQMVEVVPQKLTQAGRLPGLFADITELSE